MSLQKALIVSEIGKPLTEITKTIPSHKEKELLVKVTSAGSEFSLLYLNLLLAPSSG
jgi:hypothetical protein